MHWSIVQFEHNLFDFIALYTMCTGKHPPHKYIHHCHHHLLRIKLFEKKKHTDYRVGALILSAFIGLLVRRCAEMRTEKSKRNQNETSSKRVFKMREFLCVNSLLISKHEL